MPPWLAFVAGAVGAGLGWALWGRRSSRRLRRSPPRLIYPSDHVLDLLCRVNEAHACWIALGPEETQETILSASLERRVRERGQSLARLAAVEDRKHVDDDGAHMFVAMGARGRGGALLLDTSCATAAKIDEAAQWLERHLGYLETVTGLNAAPAARPRTRRMDVLRSATASFETLSRGLADLAADIVARPVLLAALSAGDQDLRIEATSRDADPRFSGAPVTPDSAVQHAIEHRVPVRLASSDPLFLTVSGERRRPGAGGFVMPVADGATLVGALIVVGPPIPDDGLTRLAEVGEELAPRLAAALAVRNAEQRAVTDPLTQLPNRRFLESAMQRATSGEGVARACYVQIDLDHFKRLNDTLGHAAGDAALRHVARLLERTVREQDCAARVGGEEFALWLPDTSFDTGLEVAERVRRTLAESTWHWEGRPQRITCSVGIAAVPESTSDSRNLVSAADAALYRAKSGGRDRVETAPKRG